MNLRDKGRQAASFLRHTRSAVPLVLDTVYLKRKPFVAVSRNDLKLLLQPGRGESFIFYENFVERVYFQGGIKLHPGSTVVDIGANIGAFSVLARSMVGFKGRVIAIEPVAETFGRLLHNMMLNRFDNVECRRAAVDGVEGTLSLKITQKSANATAYKINDISDNVAVETAPCITLDRIMDESRIKQIDLLKIDCEGSEYGIFETMSARTAACIKQIAMEVHHIPGKDYRDIERKLVSLGFKVQSGYTWFAVRD